MIGFEFDSIGRIHFETLLPNNCDDKMGIFSNELWQRKAKIVQSRQTVSLSTLVQLRLIYRMTNRSVIFIDRSANQYQWWSLMEQDPGYLVSWWSRWFHARLMPWCIVHYSSNGIAFCLPSFYCIFSRKQFAPFVSPYFFIDFEHILLLIYFLHDLILLFKKKIIIPILLYYII